MGRNSTRTAHGLIDRFTGKTMDWPGFNRLMDDVKAGKIKTVTVWRLIGSGELRRV